jgi:hypothetical protein
VSRLEIKIKAMLEAARGDATGEVDSSGGGSNDGENSGGDDAEELSHRSSQQRERPSGLAYMFRHAATRATF